MAPSNKNKSSKKGQKAQASRPSLDENALTQLTSKIDKALSKREDEARPGKRKRQDDDEKRAKPSKRQPAPESAKKDRSGKKDKTETKDKNAMLLEDIKALGGDEEDLELVVGIDSDAEEGATKTADSAVDDAFKNELAKFASGLGFDSVREAMAEDSEKEEMAEAEEGDRSEEEEDFEPEEESEEEDEEEEEPVAASKTAPPPKAKAKAAAPTIAAPVKETNPPQEKRDRQWVGKLMIEPRPDWHATSLEELPAPSTEDAGKFGSAIASLKVYAQSLLDQDTAAYSSATSSSSSHKFMTTIMASGTLSDKISALTLAVQESPVHNVKALDSLLAMAGKKSRSQAIAALGALVDLLGNGVVLPGDRRLRPFHAQPGLLGSLQQKSVVSWKEGQVIPGKITKAHLIVWVYEDWLKSAYFKLLQLLEVWSGDEIDYSRSRTLDFVFGLLRDKPEQEANLMRLLVSKLGDREGKIASRASYLLLQLVTTHPGMKPIVIQSVEHEALLRPGQSMRTRYHAINTLNQMILSNKEPAIADNLVRIYFEIFVSLLRSRSLGIFDHLGENGNDGKAPKKKPFGKKGKPSGDPAAANEQDVAQKLVSAVLTGVNRAIPFSLTNESTLENHLDTLFRITHSSNFNTSIQALILIQQIAASKHLAVDRFYRTLYESLLDPRLITSSKQTLYLNLLYKALKDDVDVRRVKAFVKRMLQVVNLHQPSFICGILYLVAELENTFPDLKTLLTDPEDNEDDGEETYKDADAVEEDKPAINGGEGAKRNTTTYDPRKRNPEFSNAHRSCLWELIPYFSHYHPSVAVFANNLLVRQKSLPKPELANHTLIQFLDKFVYRNPKAPDTKRGASIMQPVMASGTAAGAVSSGKGNAKTPSTLNTESFWKLDVQDVAPEDVFFHEYFTQVGKPGQQSRAAKREQKRVEKVDEEEAGEEEAEDEIWQALVDSRPDIQGDDDGDADMGFSDDDSDLASLLKMSDSDDDGDDDGMQGGEGFDFGDAGSNGGVEFNDFSDAEEDKKEEESDEDDATLDPVARAKRERNKQSRQRKRDLKAMSTFASAEDYAAMLAQEEDGF